MTLKPCRSCHIMPKWVRKRRAYGANTMYRIVCPQCGIGVGWFFTRECAEDDWNERWGE